MPSPPPRVALDLTSTERERLTGWERFALNLESELAGRRDVDLVPLRRGRRTRGRIDALAVQLWWHAGGLRRAVEHASPDVVHAPAFPPGSSPRPVVWTVHDDLLFGGHPEYQRRGAMIWNRLAPRAVGRVARIVTDSHAGADDLRRAGVPPEKLRVVTPGVPALPPPSAPPRLLRLPDGRPSAPPSEFVLAVGTIERRKRPAIAIEAAHRAGIPIVLVGRIDPSAEPLDASSAVYRCEGITDAQLAWLYAHAEVFVSLSAYEGLDFPLLEALSMGTPTVASDIAVHREFGGDAVVYCSGTDPSEAAEAIEAAAGGARHPRRSLPTWSACADGYRRIYDEVRDAN